MMTLKVEDINTVQKRVNISIPSDVVNKTFQKTYEQLQKRAEIDGFRKGKAPLYLIKKIYGGHATSEVSDSLIKDNLYKAIEDSQIKPVAPPFVEIKALPTMDQEYSFSAVVDILPAIEIKDLYKNLSLSATKYELGENALAQALERFARSSAALTPIEDTAKTLEDGLHVSYSCRIFNPKEDGKTVDHQRKEGIFGGHKEIPEKFEEHLKGMTKGQNKIFPFAELFDEKTAASMSSEAANSSKDFQVELTVEALNQVSIPALDDELAKDYGHNSFDELSKIFLEELTTKATEMSRENLEVKLFEALSQKISFEVPPAIVDQIIDATIEERVQDKAQVKNLQKDKNIREMLKEESKQKARNTLLLLEVIKKESIEISEEDLKSYLKKLTKKPGVLSEEEEKALEDYMKSIQGKKTAHHESALFEKATQFLIDHSQVSYTSSFV